MRFFYHSFLQQRNLNTLEVLPTSHLLQLKQSNTNTTLSDHKPFIVHLCPNTKAIVWNIMMHCKSKDGRFNNGFRKEETKKEYQERLSQIAEQFCRWIREDRSVIAGIIAEGPISREDILVLQAEIKKQDITGWENFHLVKTNFGVTKILKNELSNQALHEDESLKEILEPELKDRVLSYRGSESYQLTNIHVPFKDSKEAYKKILYPIFRKLMLNIPEGQYRCHDVCGDKNISSAVELEAIHEVYQDLLNEFQREDNTSFLPVSVTVELKTSPDGHLKDVDGKQKYYQVDSALRITICRSNTNKNEFFDLTDNKVKCGMLAMFFLGLFQYINTIEISTAVILFGLATTHLEIIDPEYTMNGKHVVDFLYPHPEPKIAL